MNKYLVLDLETTTKGSIRKADPFIDKGVNKIVAIGYKSANRHFAIHYTQPGFDRIPHLIYPDEEGKLEYDIIVGHNIGFDLLHMWKITHLQDYFRAGGLIWDCSLAEFMLSGNTHKYPALRDIAVNKYGCSEREKLMETYWDKTTIKITDWDSNKILYTLPINTTQDRLNEIIDDDFTTQSIHIVKGAIDTFEIPQEIVIKDVMNDVADTEVVYLQQVEEARRVGMYEVIQARMEGLLATLECEYNGMYRSKEIMERNRQQYQQELDSKIAEVHKIIQGYWE